MAIDPAAGKIYWADNSGAIRVGNLNGTGSPQNLGTNYASEDLPQGVAIDPAAGKIYWTDVSSGAIRVGNLNGTGSPQNLGTNYTSENAPDFAALLRAPSGLGAPVITGGASVPSALHCSQGTWAADLLGAFLYRAPRSFTYQWSVGGKDITGATTNSYTATAPGSYSCHVTATNAAGNASQASASFTVNSFTVNSPKPPKPQITKARISSKHHTAKFTFRAASASSFQCALVKRPKGKHKKKPKPKYRACKSPKTYKHLKPGKYTFQVRALTGGVPGTPASKNFKIT